MSESTSRIVSVGKHFTTVTTVEKQFAAISVDKQLTTILTVRNVGKQFTTVLTVEKQFTTVIFVGK